MPPSPVQKASRATAIIAVVVSLLALALAAAAFFKPQHDATPAAPQYSDQQVADAKKIASRGVVDFGSGVVHAL